MKHPILEAIGSLSNAADFQLEDAVDVLTYEASTDQGGQVERAEALALLSHEFRRRGQGGGGGVMARDNPLVTVVSPKESQTDG